MLIYIINCKNANEILTKTLKNIYIEKLRKYRGKNDKKVLYLEKQMSKVFPEVYMHFKLYACTSTSVHSIDDICKASRGFLHFAK